MKVVSVAYLVDPNVHYHLQFMMECYNVFGEPKDDDELQNINILEREGSRDVTAPDVPNDPMSQPLKIGKVNIGKGDNPKVCQCWVLLG